VPGLAWAQALGLGQDFKASGLQQVNPHSKLIAVPGLHDISLFYGHMVEQMIKNQKQQLYSALI